MATQTRSRFLVPLLMAAALALGAAATKAETYSGVWTQRTLARTATSAPGARAWIDLIFDSVTGRPVLFGGSTGTYMNDVLEMDFAAGQWTETEPNQPSVTPLGPPCPRDEHAVEFDAYNRLYWTYGGSGFACGAYSSSVGSGSTSTTVVDLGLGAADTDYYRDWLIIVAAGYNNHRSYVTHYDPVTRKLTLRDPYPGDPTGQYFEIRPQLGGGTWYYNPVTHQWRGMDGPASGYAGPNPLSRGSPAFAYSTLDAALVMFGGETNNDTWALDVQTKTWSQLRANGAAGQPQRRAQVTNSLIYDSASDAFVLFGGRCGEPTGCTGVPMLNNTLGDTWTYRLSTNSWSLMSPLTSPPPTEQHTLSYDPRNMVVVMFGGAIGGAQGTLTNDVWVYELATNTWSQVSIAGQLPPVRRLHAMVYDPVVGEHIVYGGNVYGSSGQLIGLGDVWSLRLTRSGINVPPTASLVINPASGNLNTVFRFDGSASRDPDGSIALYSWNFGDGTGATGPTATHQYATIGSYTVTLTVTDDHGATGSNSSTIVVATDPTPTTTTLASSQNPSTVGNSVTFTATVSGSSSPTGSVAFTDNGTTIAGCASIALAGTIAQCATSALATGSHSIVAAYGGDAANAASISPAFTQTVSATSGSINVALAANGGVASASSTYASVFPPASANNGDRKGVGWGSGGGWNDATSSGFPDWLQITFAGAQTISEIDVFTLQDSYHNPIEPQPTTTFSLYGITDFEVQYWNGTAWATIPGGIVTANNKVWRQFTFPAITTDRIRVLVTNALANYSRITEIEAWTP